MTSRSLLIAIVLVAALSLISVPLRADLVSWWKFEGNCRDSISGNDGSPHGDTSYTPGFVGLGIHTDGSADGVNVNDSPSLALTQSLTIRANIKSTGLATDPLHWSMIFFRGDDRSALDPFFLAIDPSGQLVFHVESLSAAEEVSAAVPMNKWVTVMASLDDASGLMRLYIDDALVASKTTTVRPFKDLDPTKLPGIGIGGHGSYPSNIGTIPFHGYIDEVKVFNSAELPEAFRPVLLLQNQVDQRVASLTVSGTHFSNSATITPTLPVNWKAAAYADFNHDGWNDIVVQNSQTRAISILFVKANRIFSSVPINPTLPPNWRVVAAGDFNADGKPDLVVQNTVTQQLAALLIDGANITKSKSFSANLAPNWLVVGAADLIQDGHDDLVVQNSSTRQISILTLNGQQITASSPLSPTLPAHWIVGAIVDFNNDGKPDLVVQNGGTGQISVLTVVAMKITSSYSITPTALAGWTLVGPR